MCSSSRHTFTGAPDGAYPNPLIRDERGDAFYGTTGDGGLATCGLGSCGTVFKIDSAGNQTVLFDFPGGSAGSNPRAALVKDAQGNLYGTAQGNGSIGAASVVFKLDPKGQETVLLTAGPNATAFDSPLTLDAQGNLYGMSPYGGNFKCSYVSNGGVAGRCSKSTPAASSPCCMHLTEKTACSPREAWFLMPRGTFMAALSMVVCKAATIRDGGSPAGKAAERYTSLTPQASSLCSTPSLGQVMGRILWE